jgi:hypothetical protein
MDCKKHFTFQMLKNCMKTYLENILMIFLYCFIQIQTELFSYSNFITMYTWTCPGLGCTNTVGRLIKRNGWEHMKYMFLPY